MESDIDNTVDGKKYIEKIPGGWRFALYVVFGIGSIVMSYLTGKGVVGADENTAWNALGAFFGLVAAGNTTGR